MRYQTIPTSQGGTLRLRDDGERIEFEVDGRWHLFAEYSDGTPTIRDAIADHIFRADRRHV